MKNIKLNEAQKANLEKILGKGKVWENPNNKEDKRQYFDIKTWIFTNILDEDDLTTSEKKGISSVKVYYSELNQKLTISDKDLNSGQKGLFKREVENEIIKLTK